jgi:RHS repeat-associated protein
LGNWGATGSRGEDHAQHRDYNSNPYRCLTPDPGGLKVVHLDDPQTWNMYAYAGNNPTTNTDPDGETYKVCQTDENGKQTNCTDISDEQFAQFQQENKDTLTFTGSGDVLQNGTVIGSYEQTSVDLSPSAQAVFSQPVLQTTAAAMSDPRTYALWLGASATVGYGLYAAGAFEGGLTTLGLEAPEAVTPSAGQVAQAEQVLIRDGRGALQRAIRSLEKRIIEHEEKIRNATGHTSSMERELENFKQLLQAYKQVLGGPR